MLLLAIFALDPLGLTTAADKASTDTLNRLVSLWYPDDAQKEITVILIDDTYLQEMSSHWPLSYTQQSILFRQILSYGPAALFIDLIYHHDRSQDNDSLQRLESVFQRFAQAKQVPIFLPTSSSETDYVAANQLDAIRPVRISWDGFNYHYPLAVSDIPTPAKALYLDYCMRKGCDSTLPEPAPPIALQWGSRLSDMQSDISDTSHCVPSPTILSGIGKVVLSEVFWKFVPRWRQNCPYHNTLQASQLAANDEEAKALLRQMISGKMVMVGALIQGARDEIASPVHGQLPGVYLHAMALDNLLTYGADYLRPAPDVTQNIDVIDFLDAILLVLVVLWEERIPKRGKKKARRKYRLLGGSIILAIIGTTAVTTFIFNYEPVNWLGLLLVVFSVALYQLHWRALYNYLPQLKGKQTS